MADDQGWNECLERSRRRPDMALGRPDLSHRWEGIEHPLRQCFVTRSLYRVRRAEILLSEGLAAFVARGGALHPEVDAALEGTREGNLLQRLSSVYTQFMSRRFPTGKQLIRADTHLWLGGSALTLAPWGLIGLRSRGTLLVQSFVDGAPVIPLSSVEVRGVGAIQAICFRSEWFTGLPFTDEDVSRELWPQIEIQRHRFSISRTPLDWDTPEPPKWLSDPEASVREVLRVAGAK